MLLSNPDRKAGTDVDKRSAQHVRKFVQLLEHCLQHDLVHAQCNVAVIFYLVAAVAFLQFTLFMCICGVIVCWYLLF